MSDAKPNQRSLESGLRLDRGGKFSYDGYLHLERLLNAQQPWSDPEHHDELLFIIAHQTSELWMKLLIHELQAASARLAADNPNPALKMLARCKQIQRQLFEQWSVLETLTPSEYVEFRDVLGSASGFQSLQYRIIEFLLGNKHAGMLRVFAHQPENHERLRGVLEAPSLYDQLLRFLARQGHPVPKAILQRDLTQPHRHSPDLVGVFKTIYEDRDTHWQAYHLCEQLVDVEEWFQLWRFRHLKTVERIIGHKKGTGGSSGVGFLQRALDLRFFPELIDVRTLIE